MNKSEQHPTDINYLRALKPASKNANPDLNVDQDVFKWQDYAECKGADPDVFFPRKGETAKLARAICNVCKVKEICLEFSIDTESGTAQEFGVWGGEPEVSRRRIKQANYRKINRQAS